MNMLIDTLLNRQTALAVRRKRNKTSLRSSFVLLHLLRNKIKRVICESKDEANNRVWFRRSRDL